MAVGGGGYLIGRGHTHREMGTIAETHERYQCSMRPQIHQALDRPIAERLPDALVLLVDLLPRGMRRQLDPEEPQTLDPGRDGLGVGRIHDLEGDAKPVGSRLVDVGPGSRQDGGDPGLGALEVAAEQAALRALQREREGERIALRPSFRTDQRDSCRTIRRRRRVGARCLGLPRRPEVQLGDGVLLSFVGDQRAAAVELVHQIEQVPFRSGGKEPPRDPQVDRGALVLRDQGVCCFFHAVVEEFVRFRLAKQQSFAQRGGERFVHVLLRHPARGC